MFINNVGLGVLVACQTVEIEMAKRRLAKPCRQNRGGNFGSGGVMENDKPKFCKDCRFYSPAPRYPVPFGGSYCKKYAAQCISLEDGSMFLRGVMTPNAVRESTQPGMCGPQGRHFEQKPKWWKFWTREG